MSIIVINDPPFPNDLYDILFHSSRKFVSSLPFWTNCTSIKSKLQTKLSDWAIFLFDYNSSIFSLNRLNYINQLSSTSYPKTTFLNNLKLFSQVSTIHSLSRSLITRFNDKWFFNFYYHLLYLLYYYFLFFLC